MDKQAKGGQVTTKDRIVEIIGKWRYGLYDWERIKAMIHPVITLDDAQWVFQAAREIVILLAGDTEQKAIQALIEDIEANSSPIAVCSVTEIEGREPITIPEPPARYILARKWDSIKGRWLKKRS